MEGGGRGAFGASPSMMAMMFLLFVGYLALFDGQMTFPMANAVFHGKNLPKAFSNNSTHSQPLTFQQYVLQNGGVGMSLANGTRPEDLIVEDYSEEEMVDQAVDIENYERQKQAFMDSINRGNKIPVMCETEIRDGETIFTKCRDIFPIKPGDTVSVNKTTHQIGPFPVPRFPFHKKCSATNPPNVPPTKLTITPAIYTTSQIKENPNFCQPNDLYICYASAFEGSTNMDFWEILKLENIWGNNVATMCNKNDTNRGIKWHGFRIVRKCREQNISEEINGNKVVKRYTFTDTMELSYRGKKIELNDGEFFHQLIFTEKGIEVFTSRRNIYWKKEIIGIKYPYPKYFLYDPGKGTNFSKRADLMDIDLSSAQRIYFAFNYNASLWSLPFDIAIMEPSKYNVSIEGIPNVKNLKISAMKVVYNTGESNIKPEIDIGCHLEWKKMAPVAFNFTLVNGTNVIGYFVKYGYLKYNPTNFIKDYWYNIHDEFSKLEANYAFLKNKTEEFKNKMIASMYEVQDAEMKYAQVQITKEEYDHGMMTAKLTCLNGEAAYGWFKFNPDLAADKIEPDFDYTNDFQLISGCKKILRSLSVEVPKPERERKLLDNGPTHNGKLIVGITGKNDAELTLQKEDIKKIMEFVYENQDNEWFGQIILPKTDVVDSLKEYKIEANFRKPNVEMLKKVGLPAEILDDENKWGNGLVKYNVYQEVYDCPKMEIYTPRVGGQLYVSWANDEGIYQSQQYTFNKHQELKTEENPIDTFILFRINEKCEIVVIFNKELYCRWEKL